ncbi:MAG: UbiD family decarboxylase [Fimbriimonadaceae bacterium]|nr:UbiD family decarboxylase [Alphaproteobacteria bacterium]
MKNVNLGDLGAIIEALDKAGRLTRVSSEVDPNLELAGIAARLEGQNAAVLFDKVKGFDAPVFTGLYWSRQLLAELLGTNEKDLSRFVAGKISDWQANPEGPVVVKSGRVKEVTQNTPDVTKLPIPLHAERDGGPYFDVSAVIAKDPDSGIRNTSIHRVMVVDKDTLVLLIDPGRHLGVYLDKARAKGEALSITINVGVSPGVYFAAATPSGAAPVDTDELGIASLFQGSPLELVAGDTSDVEMVADAMYALECEILPEDLIDEGPFAEVTGLYATRAPRQKIKVKAVHHRSKPIFHTLLSGVEVFNSAGLLAEGHLQALLPKQIPGIKDIYMSHGGCGVFHAVIQMSPTNAGWPKTAIMAAFSAFYMLKMVTVVDEDVDIRNPSDVEWAMATRLMPETGIIQIPDVFGLGLNPTFPNDMGTKVGFDCTRAIPHREKDDRVSYKQVSLDDYNIKYGRK